jgi:hypothetical protein
MGTMRKTLLAAAIAALPAPAAAQELCAGLNRIVAAAQEPVPFASLENAPQSVLPGFDRPCRVHGAQTTGARAFICSQYQFAPKSLAMEILGPAVRDCLDAEPLPGRPFSGVLSYGVQDLVVTVSSHCEERCHVGRSATLSVERRPE